MGKEGRPEVAIPEVELDQRHQRLKEAKETKSRDETRLTALEILGELPIVGTVRGRDEIYEERLISRFSPQVEGRNMARINKIVELQAWLKDLLTDEIHFPRTAYDSERGMITITTRQSILAQTGN